MQVITHTCAVYLLQGKLGNPVHMRTTIPVLTYYILLPLHNNLIAVPPSGSVNQCKTDTTKQTYLALLGVLRSLLLVFVVLCA